MTSAAGATSRSRFLTRWALRLACSASRFNRKSSRSAPRSSAEEWYFVSTTRNPGGSNGDVVSVDFVLVSAGARREWDRVKHLPTGAETLEFLFSPLLRLGAGEPVGGSACGRRHVPASDHDSAEQRSGKK